MEEPQSEADLDPDPDLDPDLDPQLEHQRMRWASRRGMLELDLILEPFVSEHYDALDTAGRLEYRRLMECQDQELFAWFLKREVPEDPGLAEMVRLIAESRSQ